MESVKEKIPGTPFSVGDKVTREEFEVSIVDYRAPHRLGDLEVPGEVDTELRVRNPRYRPEVLAFAKEAQGIVDNTRGELASFFREAIGDDSGLTEKYAPFPAPQEFLTVKETHTLEDFIRRVCAN
jgi:hypothetical protein